MSYQPKLRAQTPNEIFARRIRKEAELVWGNAADAEDWLIQPHCELEGKSPISLLKTEEGLRKVEELLGALEFGFPI